MSNNFNKEVSYDSVLLLYLVGVLGAIFLIIGVSWDASWHLMYLVESFWVLPHLIIYSGMFFILFASTSGFLLWILIFKKEQHQKGLFRGFFVSLSGSLIQLIGGTADIWWHDNFGFDPYLFTPSHLILLSGIGLNIIGISIGIFDMFKSIKNNSILIKKELFQNISFITLVMTVILGVLRLNLDALVYVLADVRGIAYTFSILDNNALRFSVLSDEVQIIRLLISMIYLSFFGTSFLFFTKKILSKSGQLSLVIGLSMMVTLITGLIFQWLIISRNLILHPIIIIVSPEGSIPIIYFIPLFILFIIPIIIFDYRVKDTDTNSMIIGLVLVSPFIVFLDGWLSAYLFTNFLYLVPIFIPIIMIVSYITIKLNYIIITRKDNSLRNPKSQELGQVYLI